MAATDQELLDAVNDGIFYILNGGESGIGKKAVQEYKTSNRYFRHIPLDKLREMKSELEAKISGARTGGTTNYADFSRPKA